MRGKARTAGLLALTAALFVLAFAVTAAQADTGSIIEKQNEPPTVADGWQAGTCTSDEPTKCSPVTPGLFFKQAAGHPQIGFTQYILRHGEELNPTFGLLQPIEEPIEGRTIKTLRVDLPPGLTVNPQATTEQCTLADFERELGGFHVPACAASTIVGREEVTLATNVGGVVPAPVPPFPPGLFLPKGFVIPPNEASGTKVPVYNLVPKEGEPALFGFVIAGKVVVFLETEVAWDGDYHESFRIRLPSSAPPFSTLKSRLVSFGRSGNGTYVTNPTTCFDPTQAAFLHTYSTFFRAESHEEPNPTFPNGSTPFEAVLPEGVQQEGCVEVPFDPSLEVEPGTAQVDSPAAPTVTTELPFVTGGEEISESHLRSAKVALPEGMGLNPSAAKSLEACTDAQLGEGTRNPVSCPAGSKIGTVEIETPPLPAGSLTGNVYLGQQLSRDPTSGEEFRIFVDAESARYGISVRLVGHVSADPNTGQLTTTFDEPAKVVPLAGTLPHGLPQAPFTSVKLQFDQAKGLLTSPPACAPSTTTSVMEPWSTPVSTKTPTTSFALTSAPGGGACPKTLAERPFSPGYSAGPRKSKAGAYSPFELHLTRPDGAQELRRVETTLPPGMVAKLRGPEYCPEASIAAAAGEAGRAVIAKPVCPDKSFVGTVGIDAGSGPSPLHVDGNIYYAGPYKGAPVSLVFVTPAVAGPYDLGTVVVRTALYVDPETAQVKAVSDPIPDVFGGVKLDVRAIDVSISRKNYTLNPTNCRSSSVASNVFGGGANPADPAAWLASAQASPFKATNCRALGFQPQFYTRILGDKKQTRRAANPKFRAILKARKGDANLRRAAFQMPHAAFLDQSHIRTICTRVQLASNSCPKQAIYGNAKATSPLLNGALEGPVYLTSSTHELPDLLADLHGQVNIRLRGEISGVHGHLKAVFFPTPDVAVDTFVLTMRGGHRGLLINSENLCARKQFGHLNLKAQNDKRLKTNRLRLNVPACRHR